MNIGFPEERAGKKKKKKKEKKNKQIIRNILHDRMGKGTGGWEDLMSCCAINWYNPEMESAHVPTFCICDS